MITSTTLLTFFGMAIVTYATRVLGFFLLRNRKLSGKAKAVMDVAPGCVLVSVIAPFFVSSETQVLVALAVCIVSAWRFSMLTTVALGVAVLGLLNQFF